MKQEELFDVVNEKDEVTGSAPRSVVHARGLLHRAVHIWVFNARGELLIQLRSARKDRHPSTWDSSASGHVDSGESYDQAAGRETKEELGMDNIPELREIGYVSACETTGREFVKIYQTLHEGPFVPCPHEIDEIRWIQPVELSRWMQEKPENFAPALPYLWQLLKTG